MESVSDQIIIFHSESPIGDKNGTNLVFTTTYKFDPTSLEVFLSGIKQDRILDFVITGEKEFTIVLKPNDPTRLNVAPCQGEPFSVKYIRC